MRPPLLLVGYRKLLLARLLLIRERQKAFSDEAIASFSWYQELLPVRPPLLSVGTESFFW
jgi:hypothetical protein